ncbi:MAG: aspartate aminotransferase family protein [Rhizobiaceae bacterium]
MDSSALFQTYSRAPVEFERGNGCWLHTTDGEQYLDFGSGIAVSCLGHAHPHLVKAITDQAEKLWHVSNLYEISSQGRLAQRLVANSFADRVFFGNSGAEALECAIKTARRYHYVNGAPERYRIVTFAGAFHGRTLATLAAAGQEKYLEGYGPRVDGFDQVELGDLDAVKAAITDETAGILLEPIQGEGGIVEPPSGFLRELRELCDEHGILLMFDEVQTGFGRTGDMFAYKWSGIEPDILAAAKGIGGGFPLGACLATNEASAGMTPSTHATTYGGNLLAMAAGNAVLDIILQDGFFEDVQRRSLIFKQGLASIVDRFPGVFSEVRGKGFLLGLKCVLPNTDVNAALREANLLAVPAGGNVIRLLPPLIVDEKEISQAIERIENAAAALSAKEPGNGAA